VRKDLRITDLYRGRWVSEIATGFEDLACMTAHRSRDSWSKFEKGHGRTLLEMLQQGRAPMWLGEVGELVVGSVAKSKSPRLQGVEE